MTEGSLLQWGVSLKRRQGVRIYRLTGILTDTREAFDMIDRIRADLEKDPRPILLDLRNVKRVTSAGVGVIATVLASAQNVGQKVALSGLTPPVEQILAIVHFNLVLAIFKTADDALKAVKEPGWSV